MCRESREDKECLLTKSRKDKKDRKRIVVAATGASGLPILKMCLQIIREDSDYESILILSDSAKITLQQETKDTVEEIEALADQVCDTKDIGAGPASGSFRTEGMLIVPCSMKTVAGIDRGHSHRRYPQRLCRQSDLASGRCDDQGTADTGPCSKRDSA